MTVGLAQQFEKVRSYDLHPDLIFMWKAIKNGWIPPDIITEQQYKELRTANTSAIRGFAGFACSYGAKWFGGYARGQTNKKIERNYALESKKSLLEDVSKIQNVEFVNADFSKVEINKNDLVYCDPPYVGTTGYEGTFSSIKFWFYVRKWTNLGAFVYVSEYRAPSDFKIVWEYAVNGSMSKKVKERLFCMK